MYCEERKLLYIDESGRTDMRSLFKKTEEYESSIETDIGEMRLDEFGEMIRWLEYTNINTLNTEVSKYQKYREWCLKNGMNVDCTMLTTSEKEECLVRQNRFLKYEELLKCIEKLKNPCDKVILLSIAEGICLKGDYIPLFKLKLEAFHKVNDTFYLFTNGKKYEVSEVFYNYAKVSAACYTRFGERQDLWSGGYVIKTAPNEEEGGIDNFAPKLRYRIRKAKEELGYCNIDLFLCAKLYHLNSLCKKNTVSIDSIFKTSFINEYIEKFGAITYSQKRDLLIEYKKAFPSEVYEEIPFDLKPQKRTTVFRGKKIDYLELNRVQIEIGKMGEQFIFERECKKIKEYGIEKDVIWVSREYGDGEGYDILSYDSKGEDIYIEVKTTLSHERKEFYITETELQKSIAVGEQYRLYRVSNFDIEKQEGTISVHIGSLNKFCNNPILYKVCFE